MGFSGRATRSEYWFWILFTVILSIVAAALDGVIGTGGILYLISALVIFLPSLAVLFRRLHDTDRKAWWILIYLVPVIGVIVILVFTVIKGTEGENRFGPDPLQGSGAADPAPAESAES